MNIFVMRHGQTVWNEKRIIQGRKNNRLSKEGIKVTQEVAEQIKDICFDVIFSSPLMRTVQTANIINQYHGVQIVKDADLIEIDQGIFAGRKENSLTERELSIKGERLKSAGMESFEDCLKRIENFVERLKKENFQNVLIVTHYYPATFIEDVVCGNKIDFSETQTQKRFSNSKVKNFVLNI